MNRQGGEVSVFGLIGPTGPGEMLVLLMIGVLLFGKRLPEIGKNIGKGLLEFKKGVNEFREAKEEKQEPKAMMEDSITDDTPKFESPG